MTSLVLLFGALLIVFFIILPNTRPSDRRFTSGRRPMRTLRDLARAGSADDAAGWVVPVVALLALATITPLTQSTGATAGAALGLFCGVLTVGRGPIMVRNWILTGLGIIASFAGLEQLLASSGCTGTFIQRIGMLVLTLAAFAVGLLITILRFSLNANVGLQAFVVVDIATFLAAPLGVDLVGGSRWVAIIAAVALGFLVGLSPEFVFSLVGFGIGAITVWAATQPIDACSPDSGNGEIAVLFSGIVTYMIAVALVNRLQR